MLVPAIKLREKYPITECAVYYNGDNTSVSIVKKCKKNRRSHTLSFNFKRNTSYISPNMNVLLRNTRNGINRNLSIFRSKAPSLKPAAILSASASVGSAYSKNGKKDGNVRKTHNKEKSFSSFTFFALKKKFLANNGRSNSAVGNVNPAIVVNFEAIQKRSQSNPNESTASK